jgi:hypothetical protein
MVREDETDDEVYHRYLRVRNQAVATQQVRSLSSSVQSSSASNVISIELWRDKLARRRQEEA